jgi:hypothetical protein
MTYTNPELIHAVKVLVEEGFTISHIGLPSIQKDNSLVPGEPDVYTIEWEESFKNNKHQCIPTNEHQALLRAAELFIQKYEELYS